MRRVLLAVSLVGAGVLIYLTLKNEMPPADVPPAKAQVASEPPQDPSIESTEKAHRLVKTEEGKVEEVDGFSPEALKKLAKHSDAFLTQKGAGAYNLLAVFSATGDRRYLEQALKQFPNSAAVLYVALADAPKEERAALIERFKAADPNNPLPWIFSAAEMFEDKRVDEAFAEVREALKRPGFYTYFNERAAAMRQLALQSGSGDFNAESISLFSQSLPHLQAARAVARGLNAQVYPANSSIRETATLMYDLGRMFQTPEASRLLIGQLVGMSLEGNALSMVNDFDVNPLPVEYKTRTDELTKIRDEAKALSGAAARVYAEPALWKGYFARFRTEGEMAALRWVQQQPATPTISVQPKGPEGEESPK